MILVSLTLSGAVYAASVDVKDLDASEDTTIEIKKGRKKKSEDDSEKTEKPTEEKSSGSKWTTETDSVDITGDPAALQSEARQDWKKKCDDWKKEFKDSNKGAKIINMSCGTPTCSGDVGSKTCVSKATYKIKVKEE
jgi:hypothetical protein